MLARALRIGSIVSEYKREWKTALDDILAGADADIDVAVREKLRQRRLFAIMGGVSVPLFLDIIGSEEDPNGAHYLASAFCVGMGLFDDATERLPSYDKALAFDWFSASFAAPSSPRGDDATMRSATYMISHVVSRLTGSERARFYAKAREHSAVVHCEDTKSSPDLELRARVGTTFGEMVTQFMESRMGHPLPYGQVILQLCAGWALLDDMTDVCDDFGVKVTKPTSMLGGRTPSLGRIISSGIIPVALRDADVEFRKAHDHCSDPGVLKRYDDTVGLIKGYGVLNLFRRYARCSYGIHV